MKNDIYKSHVTGNTVIKKEDGYYAVWATNIGVGQWADWFFTSLDLPKLHIKQCYMVKNYFKKHNHTETIISEVGEVREQVIRACRFDFNNDFQPVKTTGLINDYKNLSNYINNIAKRPSFS